MEIDWIFSINFFIFSGSFNLVFANLNCSKSFLPSHVFLNADFLLVLNYLGVVFVG